MHTSKGTRASADVITDIDTYSGWDSAYRPVGIFFDEAASTASEESLYAQYAAEVRTDFGSDSTVSSSVVEGYSQNCGETLIVWSN